MGSRSRAGRRVARPLPGPNPRPHPLSTGNPIEETHQRLLLVHRGLQVGQSAQPILAPRFGSLKVAPLALVAGVLVVRLTSAPCDLAACGNSARVPIQDVGCRLALPGVNLQGRGASDGGKGGGVRNRRDEPKGVRKRKRKERPLSACLVRRYPSPGQDQHPPSPCSQFSFLFRFLATQNSIGAPRQTPCDAAPRRGRTRHATRAPRRARIAAPATARESPRVRAAWPQRRRANLKGISKYREE